MTRARHPCALVVGASASLVERMRPSIEEHDVDLMAASSAEEARSVIEERAPAVVIVQTTDASEAGRVVRELRSASGGRRLPIILCSRDRSSAIVDVADTYNLSLLITGEGDDLCTGVADAVQHLAHQPEREEHTQTILVVDDSPAVQVLTRSIFTRAGYDVDTFGRVTDALEHIHDHADFDAVLLDLNLPDGTGFDVLREIRNRTSVPVFIVSSMRQSEQIDRAFELGATDFIEKPFHPRELLTRMERHL